MNRFEKFISTGITKIMPTYHHNEELLIMESSQMNYSSTQNNIEESPEHIDCIERELTQNDISYLHEKSKANRINEWQAAWNVTNAIQVY